MKTQLKAVVIAYLLIGPVSMIFSQDDFMNFYNTATTDLKTVANAYLLPAGKAFSSGLGADWYNTAEVHTLYGFDVTMDAGAVFIPSIDQSFMLSSLKNLKPTDPNITQAPTFGGSGNGVELNLMQPKYLVDGLIINPLWNNGTGKIASFTSPEGISKYLLTTSIKLTVGLPFVNDVSFRFMPKVKVSGFESSMWGIGFKHNLNQWVETPSMLPFDAAIILTYSKSYITHAFALDAQITPDKLFGADLEYVPDFQLNAYSTQALRIDATSVTANIIVSKNLTFVTPYLGAGLSIASSDLTMVGIYPTIKGVVPVISGASIVAKMQIENVTNPIHISSNEVMPNLTVGVRLKAFSLLTFHTQYTLQKYPVASVGLGLTFN